jgi:hypothetical protein
VAEDGADVDLEGLAWVLHHHPEPERLAPSTICEVLRRRGLTTSRGTLCA